MASTSPRDIAQRLLDDCLARRPWSGSDLDELVAAGGRELFTIVVERLGDLFQPALADAYAHLFSHAIARVVPEAGTAPALYERFCRIRSPQPFSGDEPERVVVLSRITLGADIAVTSVFLDAALRRFPGARVVLASPSKNFALFAHHPRIEHLPVRYGRAASLADRLAVWPELRALLDRPATLVIDPDSRLTQLGLLPVVSDESHYLFFDSRSAGGDSPDPLPAVASRWCREILGVEQARNFLAPIPFVGTAPQITASFGVGENQDKRVAGDFERAMLSHLLRSGLRVLLDKGAPGEEAERIEALADALRRPPNLELYEGDYAPFAARILASRLYAGYDSVGQHVAAAGAVPLVSVFAGYPSQRMFQRWTPHGPGARQVVQVQPGESPEEVLARALPALDSVLRAML